MPGGLEFSGSDLCRAQLDPFFPLTMEVKSPGRVIRGVPKRMISFVSWAVENALCPSPGSPPIALLESGVSSFSFCDIC